MTCMKQEFCIHEKYCQRHIGQNFDSCILFSRNSKPMTNEEWLRSCSTEELREFLFYVFGQGVMFGETHEKVPMFPDDEVVTVSVFDWWLREKHDEMSMSNL